MSDVRVFECERDAGRLDRFLAERCADLSRSRIQRLIAEGAVAVDGRRPAAAYRLRAGSRVAIRVPPPSPTHMRAQSIPIAVLHEDDYLLVVDKPAGMAAHPGAGHPDSTLVNALLGMRLDIGSVGGALRPGIVHRLDKDTSGLMVVAKTDRAHAALTAQFRDRSVRKGYLALVAGAPEPPAAIIDAPIGRDPDDRKRMAVVDDGKPATTTYRTIERFAGCAYLDVRPKTGRTHQIRVHLASIGCPVVGDATYGRADARIGRQFLHAATLEFEHPASGRRTRFERPLPDELSSALDRLR